MKLQLLLILLVVYVFTYGTFGADIEMNVANVSHPFYGFGAQVWPGDSRVEALCSQLNLKYFRVAPGGCPTPPTGATVAQMDNYVNSEYNGTGRGNNVTACLQIAQRQNVKVIFIRFGGPSAWLGAGSRLLSQYFDDYARLWASEIYFFKSRGLRVDYVELFNEPEGDWNAYCPGGDYNTVIKLVRAELDSRGLTDVGIIGPGLAYLYYGTSWIGALDTDGKNSLSAWSTHAWDEGWGHTDALPSFLDQRWRDYFGAAVNAADPTHVKPVIVTEYASGVRTFNGVTYGTNEYGDTSQFAERCYENALTLANNGANVLCFWEAANQSWQSQPMYAFLRIDSTKRPTYYVYSSFAPYIPSDAMVVTKTWNDPVISAAGFIGSERLVLAFANSSANTVNRSVKITGVTTLAITNALAFVSGAVVDKTSEITFDYSTGSFNISLPRESTLTVVATLDECSIKTGGDLNGDCKVNFQDFAKAASVWMTDNRQTESNVIDNFESYPLGSFSTWTPTPNVTLTIVNDVVHSGSKALKYAYNCGASPYYAKSEFRLPGVVWNTSGLDWTGKTQVSFWYKVTVKKEPMSVKLVDCFGSNVYQQSFGTIPVGDWTEGILNLTLPDSYGHTLTAYELAHIGRIDVVFSAVNYGAGTVYFDDISVSNSNNVFCSAAIENDINNDCTIDFEDIKVLGDNWLNCTLIDQSGCW